MLVPVVEDDYDGPRLSEDGVTTEFVGHLIERFTNQKKIHKKYAYKVNHKRNHVYTVERSFLCIYFYDIT